MRRGKSTAMACAGLALAAALTMAGLRRRRW